MGILDELLGGGDLQHRFEDFGKRFEQGHPSEGYTDQEVVDRYQDVVLKLLAKRPADPETELFVQRGPVLGLAQQNRRSVRTNAASSPRQTGGPDSRFPRPWGGFQHPQLRPFLLPRHHLPRTIAERLRMPSLQQPVDQRGSKSLC